MNVDAERRVIEAGGQRPPVTRQSLASDLARLGVAPGQQVLVHSALSRLGWIAGGPQALLLALADAVGETGTLVMPAQSGQLSDPAGWQAPPVPESWWPVLREELPAYDPALTPTRGMGAVAELFRTLPGTRRSAHPLSSFAARGPAAATLLEEHRPGDQFGETSPLARLYDAGAQVLLLGVGYGNCTCLHLAEHRADFAGKSRTPTGAPVQTPNGRRWLAFDELTTGEDDFARLGEAFATATGAERRGPVGWGEGRLAPMRTLVDFAVGWMEQHR